MDLLNKRAALCLSGQARAVKDCFSSIIDCLIKPFGQVDVFIHSWFVDTSDPNKFDIFHTNVLDCSTQEYMDMYNPVVCMFEDFEKSKYIQYNTMLERCRIMFYSIYRCNEIKNAYEKENSIKYDYIIRCRSDLLFERKIEYRDISWVDDNSILIPNMLDFGGVNDQFAIGTTIGMNKYASIHKEIDRYLMEDNQQYDPERLMKHHISSSGLNLQRFDFNYSMIKKSMKYPMGKGYVVKT